MPTCPIFAGPVTYNDGTDVLVEKLAGHCKCHAVFDLAQLYLCDSI